MVVGSVLKYFPLLENIWILEQSAATTSSSVAQAMALRLFFTNFPWP